MGLAYASRNLKSFIQKDSLEKFDKNLLKGFYVTKKDDDTIDINPNGKSSRLHSLIKKATLRKKRENNDNELKAESIEGGPG